MPHTLNSTHDLFNTILSIARNAPNITIAASKKPYTTFYACFKIESGCTPTTLRRWITLILSYKTITQINRLEYKNGKFNVNYRCQHLPTDLSKSPPFTWFINGPEPNTWSNSTSDTLEAKVSTSRLHARLLEIISVFLYF